MVELFVECLKSACDWYIMSPLLEWLTLAIARSQLSAGKYWKKYPHLDALKVAHFCPRLQEIAPIGIHVSNFPRTPLAGRACRTRHATVSSYFSTEQSRLRILWHGHGWVLTKKYSWSLLKSYFCPIFVVRNPTFVLFFWKFWSYIFPIFLSGSAWKPGSSLQAFKYSYISYIFLYFGPCSYISYIFLEIPIFSYILLHNLQKKRSSLFCWSIIWSNVQCVMFRSTE